MSKSPLRPTKPYRPVVQFSDVVDVARDTPTCDVLARFLLDQVLTPALRRLLKAPAKLIVIKTPDEATAHIMDAYLSGLPRAPVVETYVEQRKSGGQFKPEGRPELQKLQYGKSVILISQDPERILVPQALTGADAIVSVLWPSLATIRKTIRSVTGKRSVRGLQQSDIAGLTLLDFSIAIRPGLLPRDCVANLRRAAAGQDKPSRNTALPLEQLTLPKSVHEWAADTLAIMHDLNAGKLDTSALRFACLEGPPGTGKTTIASALARSADWTFISTSVGEWFAKSAGHLGDVIRAAQTFYEEIAQAPGPVVALMDEIECLPNRAAMDPKDGTWWSPVVTYTLTEIDKLRKSGRPVLLVGATNHHTRLDAALIRAGRLEQRISVLPPDEAERKALFARFVGDGLAPDQLALLARLAVNATPAQVESWCKSALAKARREKRELLLSDLLALVAPPSERSPMADRAVAIHEAGHAIAALERNIPVTEVSILARDGAGGWVNTRIADRLMSRADVEDIAIMTLAGRAADEVLGSGANGGAAADLAAVNNLLRQAMLDYGLYGHLTTADNTNIYAWQKGITLHAAIGAELKRLHEEATHLVKRREADIVRLADVLLVERVVTGQQLVDVVGAKDGSSQHAGAPWSMTPT